MNTKFVMRALFLPRCVALVAAASAVATSLFGHDLNIRPTLRGTRLEARLSVNHPDDYAWFDTNRLTGVTLHAPDGKTTTVFPGRFKHEQTILRLTPDVKCEQPGVWTLAGGYDNGFWVEAKDGREVNATLQDVPDAKSSGHYRKMGKGLVQVGAAATGFDRVVGMRVELVPVENPFAAKVGGTLPVRVLFDGKPVADAGLEIGDGVTVMKEEKIPRYKSDANGIARVPIARRGWQHIIVDYTVPNSGNAFAEKEVISSALVFQLK